MNEFVVVAVIAVNDSVALPSGEVITTDAFFQALNVLNVGVDHGDDESDDDEEEEEEHGDENGEEDGEENAVDLEAALHDGA